MRISFKFRTNSEAFYEFHRRQRGIGALVKVAQRESSRFFSSLETSIPSNSRETSLQISAREGSMEVIRTSSGIETSTLIFSPFSFDPTKAASFADRERSNVYNKDTEPKKLKASQTTDLLRLGAAPVHGEQWWLDPERRQTAPE
jgi:hypothetical protein